MLYMFGQWQKFGLSIFLKKKTVYKMTVKTLWRWKGVREEVPKRSLCTRRMYFNDCGQSSEHWAIYTLQYTEKYIHSDWCTKLILVFIGQLLSLRAESPVGDQAIHSRVMRHIQSALKHNEQEEFRGLTCSALVTTQPPCLASVRPLAPILAEGDAASSTQETSHDSN